MRPICLGALAVLASCRREPDLEDIAKRAASLTPTAPAASGPSAADIETEARKPLDELRKLTPAGREQAAAECFSKRGFCDRTHRDFILAAAADDSERQRLRDVAARVGRPMLLRELEYSAEVRSVKLVGPPTKPVLRIDATTCSDHYIPRLAAQGVFDRAAAVGVSRIECTGPLGAWGQDM